MKIKNLLRRKKSNEIAKDRLKILLISDRFNCSQEMLELIKQDIAKVISKYMKIDAKTMEIQISKTATKGRNAKNPSLYANIPILDLNKGT
ncbi:MAG: cell division topological specificity factor MinE [Lachnospiraceae bacterium]|nr:cell division topological specificity factor MinE [Lachnospiraceae bacterium]